MMLPIVFQTYTNAELEKLLASWPFDSDVLPNLVGEVLHLRRHVTELQATGTALLERARTAERERDETLARYRKRHGQTIEALDLGDEFANQRDEAVAEIRRLGAVLDDTAQRLVHAERERAALGEQLKDAYARLDVSTCAGEKLIRERDEARDVAVRNATDCGHLRQTAIQMTQERDAARAELAALTDRLGAVEHERDQAFVAAKANAEEAMRVKRVAEDALQLSLQSNWSPNRVLRAHDAIRARLGGSR